MRSITKATMTMVLGVLGVVGFALSPSFAADKPATPRKTLEAIKRELKPLRERAALEPEVIAARRALDEAYRAYWESVRAAMVRLEPEKKALIAKEIKLRQQLSAVRGEATPAPAKAAPSSPE